MIPANALMRTRLDRFRFLARTPEGAWQVSAPTDDLAPNLRAMLSLASGHVTVGEILDRAGGMSNILEGQITTLIEMGLVELVRASVVQPATAGTASDKPRELQPVAGAKIELLKQLGFFHAQGTEVLWSADRRRQELFGVLHGDRREVLGRIPFTAQS